MGSGGGRVRSGRRADRAGEQVGHGAHPPVPAVPGRPLLAALPPTVRSIAVLDRTKEPGATGEPLYLEWSQRWRSEGSDEPPFAAPRGSSAGAMASPRRSSRRRWSSRSSTRSPRRRPKRHFTVGIYDDVTHLSLPIDGCSARPRPAGEVQAVFFGLGSDGTVGANKASVKIIGEGTHLFAQGYFVYDSKKSGSVTVSHLRFGPEPIRSTYLVDEADFVACHQFGLLGKIEVLEHAQPGATFLLNAPVRPGRGMGAPARRGPAADRRQGASTCGSSTPRRRP